MVGEGPEEKRLKSLSIQLSIAQKIEWLPWIEQVELYQIYSQHDVFFFPSLHDSGGQVVLEAMAHGLPVVCLNLGGPGMIVNGICGCKIPVEGLNEEKIKELLANAILKLATDRSVRAKLSSGALNRVKDFTWASTVKDIYGNNHIESYNIHS
jgi:glycosyltransferase involved in cell wall biosynthesis